MYRRIRKIIFILYSICFFFVSYRVCYATEMGVDNNLATEKENTEIPQVIEQYATGTVKLCLYVVDNKDNKQNIRQGTGILLGKDGMNSQEEQVILTDSGFMEVNEETIQVIRRQYGLDTTEELSVGVDIILNMNTRISAEVNNSGNGYVILTPQSTIKDMQILKLGDSSSLNVRDELYVLSYGGESDIIGSTDIENLELDINSCQIAELKEDEIVTNYQMSSGEIGAPVMDKNGCVVGMFVKNQDGVLVIKSIDNIKKMLDVLGIVYESGGQGGDYNKVTKEIYSELNTLLLECQELAVQQDKYTKKSIKNLKTAINNAMSVMASSESTYDDYQACIDDLNKYRKKLHSINYPYHVTQILLGVLIFFFTWLSFRNKRQIRILLGEDKKNAVVNLPEKTKKVEKKTTARLIRCDTGQEINIVSENFRIGQSTENIDYTITDNTSVSRFHASIVTVNGVLYIVDQNSTNHTYVNGEEIVPGQYNVIKDGDAIQLSNLQFKVEII